MDNKLPNGRENPNNAPENDVVMLSAHSSLAAKAMREGNYDEALDRYRLALNDYLDGTPSVVESVNAAATCFNLGALSKKLQQHESACTYFRQAENIYRRCIRTVQTSSGPAKSDDVLCDVCLLRLVIETLQARAHVHYKHQQSADEAIECHDEVLKLLENGVSDYRDVTIYRIKFVGLTVKQRRLFLVRSLQSLGKLYVEKGDFEDGFIAYQETLTILQEGDVEKSFKGTREDELVSIIKALSDMRMRKPSQKVSQLQRLARMEENSDNWEQAIACRERILFLESQQHGEESSAVAHALCEVARVMTLQGNAEGALDLYHAAFAKYHQTKTPLPRQAVGNMTNIFCQLLMHDEAMECLDRLLAQARTMEEKAWILCQRGRMYLEQGLLEEAGQSLYQSAMMFDLNDEYVFELLRKVEFLRRRDEELRPLHTATSSSKVPLESIVEVDENSTIAESTMSPIGVRSCASTPSARRSGPSLLKTVDEQRQEDLPTSDTDEDTLFEDVASDDDRSNMGLGILRSGEDAVIVRNDDDMPNDENQGDDGIVSNRTNDEPERESVASVHSTALSSRAEVAADAHVNGDCEIHPEMADPTDRVSEIPQSQSSHSVAPQMRSILGGGSQYISSDDESDTVDEKPYALQGEVVTAKENDASVRSGSTKENDASVGGGSRKENDASVRSEQRKENDASVRSEQRKENDASVRSEQRKESDASVRSEQRQENDASVTSEQRQEKDATATIELEKENDARVTSERRIQQESTPQKLHSAQPDANKQSTKKYLQETNIEAGEVNSPHNRNLNIHSGLGARSAGITRVASQSSSKTDVAPKPQVSRMFSTRSRLVMALSSPFRRSRSKKPVVNEPLVVLEEEKEVIEFASQSNLESLQIEEDESSVDSAPVSYIALTKRSTDEVNDGEESLVSQITFKWDDGKPDKSSNDNQWWWGVTTEGLEGWFPTSYVHQAVEAAGGFLSGRMLQDKTKNQPLDFESDKDSDDEEEAAPEERMESERAIPEEDERENHEPGEVKHEEEMIGQSTEPMASSSKRKTALTAKIEEKQAHLEDQNVMNEHGDSTTAIVLFELATLQSKNREFGEALQNLQQALELQKAENNAHDACRTLHLMAEINCRTRYFQAALSCYSEARQIQEDYHGYYHEEVANILNRQGNILARQGEFDLAMENHKEALRILKECCGEEVKNPLVSQTLIQIGAVYYKERNSLKTIQKNQDGYTTFIESGMLEVIGQAHEDRGSYRMAIAFFEEKLQCLNPDDPTEDQKQIAGTLNSLGMLSCRAGLYLEAMEYYDRARGIQKRIGCDYVQVVMAEVQCASVQYFLGHFRKALRLLEAALRSIRKKTGTEEKTVATTLFHLGVVEVALGNFRIGMSNLQEAIKIQNNLLGPEHPATIRTRREIANLLVSWEADVDKALQEYNAILEIQKRIHGSRHPNIAETLHFIGCAQARNGDKELALQTLEDSYKMRLGFLGTDHPHQATTLHKIAEIRVQKGRTKKAVFICDSALSIRKECLSEKHVDLAMLMATKASCLAAHGSFTEANKLFIEASKITKHAVGMEHPSYGDIKVQVGAMHLRMCHFEEAADAISTAVEIYRKAGLKERHPSIKGALEELEKVGRAEMLCV